MLRKSRFKLCFFGTVGYDARLVSVAVNIYPKRNSAVMLPCAVLFYDILSLIVIIPDRKVPDDLPAVSVCGKSQVNVIFRKLFGADYGIGLPQDLIVLSYSHFHKRDIFQLVCCHIAVFRYNGILAEDYWLGHNAAEIFEQSVIAAGTVAHGNVPLGKAEKVLFSGQRFKRYRKLLVVGAVIGADSVGVLSYAYHQMPQHICGRLQQRWSKRLFPSP